MKTVTTFLTNMLRTTHRLDRPHPHLEEHMGAPSLSRRKHLKFGRGGGKQHTLSIFVTIQLYIIEARVYDKCTVCPAITCWKIVNSNISNLIQQLQDYQTCLNI